MIMKICRVYRIFVDQGKSPPLWAERDLPVSLNPLDVTLSPMGGHMPPPPRVGGHNAPGQNVTDKIPQGQNFTGQNTMQTKCHRTKRNNVDKMPQDKTHRRKIVTGQNVGGQNVTRK